MGTSASFHALHKGIGPATTAATNPFSSSSSSPAASRRGITTTTSSFLGFGGGGDKKSSDSSGTGAATIASKVSKEEMGGPSVLSLAERADHSWLKQLTPDPETSKHAPNRSSRQVKSGHYVRVAPTPLSDPKLVIHSPDMAANLGIAEEDVNSPAFAAFFSGDSGVVPGMETWAGHGPTHPAVML